MVHTQRGRGQTRIEHTCICCSHLIRSSIEREGRMGTGYKDFLFSFLGFF